MTTLSICGLSLLTISPAMASSVHHAHAKLTASTPLMPFQPGKGETIQDNSATFNHKTISVCVDPQLNKKPGMQSALKAAMAALPAYKFKLEPGNYHADIVIEPVEFESGQASKVTTYQYKQNPSVIHRSVVELSHDVANRTGLENEVLSDMEQAVGYQE